MERIAVDLDETVVHLLPHFLEWYNDKNRTSFTTDDFFSYRWWEVFGVEEDEAYGAFHEYIGWKIRSRLGEVDFVDGAVEALCRLRDRYEIHAITDRHPCFNEDTVEISRKLCLYRADLLPPENIHLTHEAGKRKPELCKSLGISTIVEDNASVALECAEAGVRALVLRRPWNASMSLHELVIPVAGWPEVYGHLNGR